MKRCLMTLALLLSVVVSARGHGLLIPKDKEVPPLAMLNHHINVTIEDQVAITNVEQTFRNHTSRELEATYVFPVPRDASVRGLSMWINGKVAKGELIEADKARAIYVSLVRQTRDPAILEHVGSRMFRLRVFPIPARGEQKIAFKCTAIVKKDHELVEYVYPLKTDGKATRTLEKFSLQIQLKSQRPITNVYSPTHIINVKRTKDKQVEAHFAENQALLSKDFQLFFTTSDKDVGITAIQRRPVAGEDGYVMLMISPRSELAKKQQVPRDVVFVLDTSGSMREDGKMEQAKKALQHCLDGLSDNDRFGLVTFATVVNPYKDALAKVNKDQIDEAKKWVGNLKPSGGTAIQAALQKASDMRGAEEGRTFTIVFFTDGQPTIGETDTDKILAELTKKKTASTRIFTFGVGYDLNAAFLDQIAERTRAASSYVKPEEDLQLKVTRFFDKITHPVMANLQLAVEEGVRLLEVYPPSLPDLFHGDQLIVLGRYQGSGRKKVTLSGTVGMEKKSLSYETEFLKKATDKPFVEELWARRKVGYLLDQIRLNGGKKELIAEVTALAKKYGIATAYTSYLIMPDVAVPVIGAVGGAGEAFKPADGPAALARPGAKTPPLKVEDYAKLVQGQAGELKKNRGLYQDRLLRQLKDGSAGLTERRKTLLGALDQKRYYDLAELNFKAGKWRENQIDELGVNFAIANNSLKNQAQLTPTALRRAGSRNCIEIGGVWIDEEFTAKVPTVAVKAQSDAYFRILERHPQVRSAFQLGNHLVWMTPNGTGLVIDAKHGKEKLDDVEIDKLFVKTK